MSKLKVAIISAGRMASSIDDEIRDQETWPSLKLQLPFSHAPTYKTFPDEVEMVAVCDLDEEKAKAFCKRWEVPRYYLDYRDMITREKPDILSIATAAIQHAEMVIFACANGVRGMYCEKPMCSSLEEADAIVDAVRQSGVKFMLGAQRRHHPNFKKAKEIVQSGEIGELVSATSWFSSSLLHSLSHTADGMLFFADDQPAVSAYGVMGEVSGIDDTEMRRVVPLEKFDPATQRWNGDPGCNLYMARLANGVFINHLPSITDVRFEISCANGYLRILDNNDSLHLYKRRGRTYSFDEVELPRMPHASSNRELVRDLIHCLKTNSHPLANEIAARNGMEILMGAAQSHLEGGTTIKLPQANRKMYIPAH